ncbi:hypothetical protein TGARI_368170 [Toxoplasma gondii ARI]|uniref:Uncharacterized protein n=1 Tax=Toxoplasma gondii ARI TaxID=1074872 RepID=A0A139Y9U3_TOXGO|nr:hypothetical protein TGARI_368170 [Toxoplasma gondii ARI]
MNGVVTAQRESTKHQVSPDYEVPQGTARLCCGTTNGHKVSGRQESDRPIRGESQEEGDGRFVACVGLETLVKAFVSTKLTACLDRGVKIQKLLSLRQQQHKTSAKKRTRARVNRRESDRRQRRNQRKKQGKRIPCD